MEVGRTGARAVMVLEVVNVEVDRGGHSIPVPHWRPEVQQPPPSEAGQDWKPEEQLMGGRTTSAVEVEIEVGVLDIMVDVDSDVGVDVDVDIGSVESVTVVIDMEVLDAGATVTVCSTTTVVVELRTPANWISGELREAATRRLTANATTHVSWNTTSTS
ncbi:hypothetical protein MMC19_006366 [Ptychographa xylographoides]|nr:hypothetical protein [Ptychographa xylographoides]